MSDDQLFSFKYQEGTNVVAIQSKYYGCNLADVSNKIVCWSGTKIDPDTKWWMQNPFTSSAQWTTIRRLKNKYTESITYKVEISEGFSENIQDSLANTQSTSTSLTASIGFEAYGFTGSTEIQSDVSKSSTSTYSRSFTKDRYIKDTIEVTVPPKSTYVIQ